MSHRFCASVAGLLLLAGLSVLGTGCGGRTKKAVVKGQVTFMNRPLNAGNVLFTSKDGSRSGTGLIDADGNYTVPDAPVGEVVITVTVNRPMIGPGSGGAARPPKDLSTMKPPDGSGPAMTTPTQVNPARIVMIPEKYSKAETSGLTYTVEAGEQTHNIALTP